MALPQENKVDRWEIRCRFNRSGYQGKIASGEFTFDPRKRKSVPQHAGLPPEFKFSIEWYYLDAANGDEMAHGHCYERADGTTTDHDPKHLYLKGIRYSLHRGTGWWPERRRDPALFFKHGSWLREAYVRWRRIKCKLFGK